MADGDELHTAPAPKSTAMIKAGGGVQALTPQTFEDAWRIAQAFSKSGMCPKDMSTPEQVLVAVMAGAEIGLAPFQAVQSFAVINGRPCLWGDGMLAVVRKYGTQVSERIEGDGESAVAWCKVTRPDTQEVIERAFSAADAQAAGLWTKAGPWKQYPKRMLQMRARAWALRDGCADMLRGMKMAEEVQDFGQLESELLAGDAAAITGEVEEAKGAFIMGEAWTLVVSHYTKLFADATDAESVTKHWESFKRKYWVGKRRCISNNSFDGMEALYDQALFRLENGDAAYKVICEAIDAAQSLDALEGWRAADTTEARWAKLSEEQATDAAKRYEDRQEYFAEEIHKQLAEERSRG